MSLDPKVIGELVIAAALVAINLPPLLAYASAWLKARYATQTAPSAPEPTAPKGADGRTAGDVLDCLRCDMAWLLANTDATDADVAPVEALAKFLIHTSKTTAKAGA